MAEVGPPKYWIRKYWIRSTSCPYPAAALPPQSPLLPRIESADADSIFAGVYGDPKTPSATPPGPTRC